MKTNLLFASSILTVVLGLGGCTITDVTSSTSGTLDTVTPDITLNRFVDVRIASIQQEAAQGSGENLNALAELMGKNDKQAFSLWVHNNYDALFSELSEPAELITRIEARNDNLI